MESLKISELEFELSFFIQRLIVVFLSYLENSAYYFDGQDDYILVESPLFSKLFLSDISEAPLTTPSFPFPEISLAFPSNL